MSVATRSFFRPPVGVPVSIANSQPDAWVGEKIPHARPNWWALSKYREDGDWNDYSARYMQLLKQREKVILKAVRELEAAYDNATFCCWCADMNTCHRNLFADWLTTHGWAVDRG